MRIPRGRFEEAATMWRQAQLNRRRRRSAICRGPAGCDNASTRTMTPGENDFNPPNVYLSPCPIPKTVILIAVGVKGCSALSPDPLGETSPTHLSAPCRIVGMSDKSSLITKFRFVIFIPGDCAGSMGIR